MIDIKRFKNLLADKTPDTAIILGSGLGGLAAAVGSPLTIDYADIDGFPRTTVAGHAGKMTVGRLGSAEVLCMQGRFHLYEGYRPQVIAEVVQALKAVGIRQLIITNAAGSLNPDFAPGSLMLIKDHINFSGQNPLTGANDDNIGPRFPDMSNAYDRDLRQTMKRLAEKRRIPLPEGVYMMVAGPNFETAAEIRAFRILGADAVGMSTVPEVIAAVHAGIKVIAVSAITNFGTGMQSTPLSHEETLGNARRASENLTTLITDFLKENRND